MCIYNCEICHHPSIMLFLNSIMSVYSFQTNRFPSVLFLNNRIISMIYIMQEQFWQINQAKLSFLFVQTSKTFKTIRWQGCIPFKLKCYNNGNLTVYIFRQCYNNGNRTVYIFRQCYNNGNPIVYIFRQRNTF